MVKEFLSRHNVAYIERDVSRDRNAAQELVSSTGQMGVPVTVIDGQVIIGFDRAGLERAISQKRKPSFGVSVADAASITAKKGVSVAPGAYVGRVRSVSPADRAKLKPGDIIIGLNKQNIGSAADFEKVVAKLNQGDRFAIIYLRENQKHASEGLL